MSEGDRICAAGKMVNEMLPACTSNMFAKSQVIHELDRLGSSLLNIAERIEFTRLIVGDEGPDTIRIGTKYRYTAADGFCNRIAESFHNGSRQHDSARSGGHRIVLRHHTIRNVTEDANLILQI